MSKLKALLRHHERDTQYRETDFRTTKCTVFLVTKNNVTKPSGKCCETFRGFR